MSTCRLRVVAAIILAIASVLSCVRDPHELVLCVHSDGVTALETGDDPCCLGGAAAGGSPTAFAAATGGCPGCTDVVLSAGSQQASRSKQGEPPMVVITGFVDAVHAAQRTRVAAAYFVSTAKADSPPLPLPLRV